MSRHLIATSLLLLTALSGCTASRSPALASSAQLEPGLTIRALDEATWLVVHQEPFPANSLVARMPDGRVVLADTPYHSRATAALLAWIEDTLHPRGLVAVNSHFHLDAAGGNDVLLKAGATIIGHRTSPRLMRTLGAQRAKGLHAMVDPSQHALRRALAETPIAAATTLIDERLTMRFGDEHVEVLFVGPAHAPDMLATWFRDRGLLFGGCMVRTGDHLGYLGDAHLEGWQRGIARLQELKAKRVVPGHGPCCDPGHLDRTAALLREATK